MKEPKAVYGLYWSKDAREVKTERDYDGANSGHAELYVVKVGEKDEITNDTYGPFNDLAFYCQWNEKIDGGKPFAFVVEFRKVFAVDLPQAERMLKVLRKARKAKFPLTPATFGQYCVLMARALGITKFVQCTEKWGCGYNEMTHRVSDISAAQFVIDREIAEAYSRQKADTWRTTTV